MYDCVYVSVYVRGEGVHHFHHILKWVSEIYSFERLFAQNEPGLRLSAGVGSPYRVQMDQHVWLGRDWGLGWEMAQSAF